MTRLSPLPLALALAFALFVARAADAATITVASNLPMPHGFAHIPMPEGLHGWFDVSAHLNGQQLIAANVSFDFGGSGSFGTTFTTTTQSIGRETLNGILIREFITIVEHHDHHGEGVWVTTPGASGGATFPIHWVEGITAREESLHCPSLFTCHIDSTEFVRRESVMEDLEFGYDLGPVDLAFLSGGTLPFHVLSGSLIPTLRGATLTMQLEPIRRVEGGEVSAVPEPASVSLLGAGLGWLAVMRRRQRIAA